MGTGRDDPAPHSLTPAECAAIVSEIAQDKKERTPDRLRALDMLHQWGNGSEFTEPLHLTVDLYQDPLASAAAEAL